MSLNNWPYLGDIYMDPEEDEIFYGPEITEKEARVIAKLRDHFDKTNEIKSGLTKENLSESPEVTKRIEEQQYFTSTEKSFTEAEMETLMNETSKQRTPENRSFKEVCDFFFQNEVANVRKNIVMPDIIVTKASPIPKCLTPSPMKINFPVKKFKIIYKSPEHAKLVRENSFEDDIYTDTDPNELTTVKVNEESDYGCYEEDNPKYENLSHITKGLMNVTYEIVELDRTSSSDDSDDSVFHEKRRFSTSQQIDQTKFEDTVFGEAFEQLSSNIEEEKVTRETMFGDHDYEIKIEEACFNFQDIRETNSTIERENSHEIEPQHVHLKQIQQDNENAGIKEYPKEIVEPSTPSVVDDSHNSHLSDPKNMLADSHIDCAQQLKITSCQNENVIQEPAPAKKKRIVSSMSCELPTIEKADMRPKPLAYSTPKITNCVASTPIKPREKLKVPTICDNSVPCRKAYSLTKLKAVLSVKQGDCYKMLI